MARYLLLFFAGIFFLSPARVQAQTTVMPQGVGINVRVDDSPELRARIAQSSTIELTPEETGQGEVSTVTVTVRSGEETPIAGQTVRVVYRDAKGKVLGEAQGMTDESGKVATTVRGQGEGKVEISAQDISFSPPVQINGKQELRISGEGQRGEAATTVYLPEPKLWWEVLLDFLNNLLKLGR